MSSAEAVVVLWFDEVLREVDVQDKEIVLLDRP